MNPKKSPQVVTFFSFRTTLAVVAIGIFLGAAIAISSLLLNPPKDGTGAIEIYGPIIAFIVLGGWLALVIYFFIGVIRSIFYWAKISRRGRRVIIFFYCIAIALACTYVPWKTVGYAPVWSPPYQTATVDIGRVTLELLIIFALGGLTLAVIRDSKAQ